MNELAAVFVLGLLSSAHCIGMCGGFAAAIGTTGQRWGPSLTRQILYSFGRLSTYAFLGAVAGFAGLYFSAYRIPLVTAQQGFSILAGVIMLLVGASALGLFRIRFLARFGVGELFAGMFRHLLNARSRGGFFLAGMANGFLPCGLVYAFLAQAVATANMAKGSLVMVAFGLGTMPAMVAVGCGATLLSHTMRQRVFQIAAGFVMVVGFVTIYRALPQSHAHHHVEVLPLHAAPVFYPAISCNRPDLCRSRLWCIAVSRQPFGRQPDSTA